MRELPPETMTDAVSDQMSATWVLRPRRLVSRWSGHHLDPHLSADRETNLISARVGSGPPPAAQAPEAG